MLINPINSRNTRNSINSNLDGVSQMKVILREDMKRLGNAGEMVEVSDGFARNFLIPQAKAIKATIGNIRQLEHQKRGVYHKINKAKIEAESLVGRIESLSCTISMRAGEKDKLFGSVTSRDIAQSLREEGIEIDRKNIILEEPIKALGIYTVPIKLQAEVVANLKVWVVKK